MDDRLRTTASVAKIVFLVIGIGSTTVLLSRFAVPYFLSLLSSFLPKLWSSVLLWLSPPYLFITVHFIIIVIWKLHGDQRQDDDKTPSPSPSPSPTDDQAPNLAVKSPDADLNHEISQETPPISADPPPESEPILATTDSGEKSSDPSTADAEKEISMDAMWKSIMDCGSPAAKEIEALDESPKLGAPVILERAAAADGRELRKSETFRDQATASAAAKKGKEMRKWETFREYSRVGGWMGRGGRAREVVVVGNDELSRRVEAFIKMNYDQMRLQRPDQSSSEQRYVEMVNAAAY